MTEKAPISKQLVRIKLRLKTKMKTLLKHGPQTRLRDGDFTTEQRQIKIPLTAKNMKEYENNYPITKKILFFINKQDGKM